MPLDEERDGVLGIRIGTSPLPSIVGSRCRSDEIREGLRVAGFGQFRYVSGDDIG